MSWCTASSKFAHFLYWSRRPDTCSRSAQRCRQRESDGRGQGGQGHADGAERYKQGVGDKAEQGQ